MLREHTTQQPDRRIDAARVVKNPHTQCTRIARETSCTMMQDFATKRTLSVSLELRRACLVCCTFQMNSFVKEQGEGGLRLPDGTDGLRPHGA